VTKGKIGMSPQKRGPIGHIPVVAYKSLCARFATFLRINQLNCMGGVNHRGKMAPIVVETMMVDVETAQEILKRLACETAIDLGCAKGSFAKERRVRWDHIPESGTLVQHLGEGAAKAWIDGNQCIRRAISHPTR
jgi:hypothetical protein